MDSPAPDDRRDGGHGDLLRHEHPSLSPILLAEYLALTGDTCPRCKGPVDPTSACCRSCRVPVHLGLSTVQRFAIAWTVTLAGAALSAGFALMIVVMTLLRGELPGDPKAKPAILGSILIGAAMTAAGLALLSLRRRFFALPVPFQWTLALVAAATVLVPFTWLATALHR